MSEERTLAPLATVAPAALAPTSRRALVVLGLILALLLPSRAVANVYTRVDTFTLDPLNSWADIVQITRYNWTPGLQPLSRIEFILQATLSGYVGVENLDEAAQVVEEIFGTTASLQLSGRNPLTITSVSPTQTANVSLEAYDGLEPYPPYTPDFWGTSGTTYAASATATSSYTTLLTSDLNAFTGTGDVYLGITAFGRQPYVTVSAPSAKEQPAGNLSGQTVTGTLWVVYHTPEPAALALLCLGLAAGLCQRPRRRA